MEVSKQAHEICEDAAVFEKEASKLDQRSAAVSDGNGCIMKEMEEEIVYGV